MPQDAAGKWNIAIAASFTAEPLGDAVGFWRGVLNEPIDAVFSPFGQVFQELLSPSSVLRRADAGVVLLRWADLAPTGNAGAAAEELGSALAAASNRLLVIVCPDAAPLADAAAAGAAIATLPNVDVLFADDVFRLYAVASPHDAAADASGKVPYTEEAYAALGAAIVRWRAAALRPAVKLVAVDGDHTLWTGVLAEDGVDGVTLDEGRFALHKALVRQSDAGRVLALLSKNEAEDVASFFDRRRDSLLRRDHFLTEAVDWNSKAANLAEIAERFSVGEDAILFLDDNPVECGQMRAALPAATTICLTGAPGEVERFVDHLWLLDMGQTTAEDRRRRDMYRETAARDTSRAAAPTLAAFMAGLDLKVDIFPARLSHLPRLAQLSVRTNQFNASLRRLTETELAASMADGAELYGVKVSDRFGDYGLVGAMMGARRQDCFEVGLFLLSCRALGRGVEHAMLAFLARQALEAGCASLRVDFEEGPRNAPVKTFLTRTFGEPGATADASSLTALTFSPDDEPPAAHPEMGPAAVSPASGRDSGEIYERIARELHSGAAILAAMRAAGRRERPDLSVGFAAPSSGLEQTIARIWEDVLGVAPVGAHDEFRDLGGKSLHLVRIKGRLEKALGRAVELTALFEYGTVARLARALAPQAAPGGLDAAARGAKMRAARSRGAFRREAAS